MNQKDITNKNRQPQIIAVTSGKGGVGKTNFSVNTALLLARLNQKVLIIDADIHLGNVDVLFGISPDFTLVDVLKGNKSLKEICIASKDLAQRSNEGTITTDEYARGTFAVSNLGMFNIKSFVGIIYPPQSAMLAVGSATRKPVVVEGNVVIADIMTATISGDHRIVDGAEAALFINEIKAILENPYQLLI